MAAPPRQRSAAGWCPLARRSAESVAAISPHHATGHQVYSIRIPRGGSPLQRKPPDASILTDPAFPHGKMGASTCSLTPTLSCRCSIASRVRNGCLDLLPLLGAMRRVVRVQRSNLRSGLRERRRWQRFAPTLLVGTRHLLGRIPLGERCLPPCFRQESRCAGAHNCLVGACTIFRCTCPQKVYAKKPAAIGGS
jgi:hypothetical protein